jgi:hypothetical protein
MVAISDTVAPIALCHDVLVALDENGIASVTPGLIDSGSSDNCSVANIKLNKTGFTCNDIGSNVVLLSVVDDSDNISTCQSIVTIQDTISPEVICHDIIIALDGNGISTITSEMVDAGNTDNCEVANIRLNKTNFSCRDIGENMIVLSATDLSDNVSTCQSIVTIEDTIAPQVICNNIIVALDGNGIATITSEMIDARSTDNCEVANIGLNKTNFSCSDIGENMIVLSATDLSDNVSTCQSIVTIEDTISPEALCNDIIVALDGNGIATITSEMINAESSDNCEVPNLSLNKTNFSCSDIGENMIVLSVTDISDNISTCQSIVTIEDTIVPVSLCRDTIITLDEDGEARVTTEMINAGSNDNCSLEEIVLSRYNFDCNNLGENKVVLTVTDAYKNTSFCNAIIELRPDNLSPTLDSISEQELMEDSTLYVRLNGISDGGDCNPQKLEIKTTAIKSFGIKSISSDYTQGSTFAVLKVIPEYNWFGQTEVIVEISDSEGAEVKRVFNLIVHPVNDAPELVNPIADYQVNASHKLQVPIPSTLGILFTDPDIGDKLEINLKCGNGSTLPSCMVYINDTLTVTPVIADTGLVTVLVTAIDLKGAMVADTFILIMNGYKTDAKIISDEQVVNLYPNPSPGIFNIKIGKSNVSQYNVSVFNSKGKRVLQGKYNSNLMKINMRGYVSGIYYIKVEFDGKEVIKKLVLDNI